MAAQRWKLEGANVRLSVLVGQPLSREKRVGLGVPVPRNHDAAIYLGSTYSLASVPQTGKVRR